MDVQASAPVAQAKTFADKVKDFFQLDKLAESLDLSTPKLIKMGAYAAVGFLLGFFLKKYGRSLFIVLTVFAALLYVLSYSDVITINWDQARDVIGLAPTETFDSILQTAWQYIQQQALLVICGLVGFIIGYKVG